MGLLFSLSLQSLQKVAVAKADEETIWLFKAEILIGHKDMLLKWIVDLGASTYMSSQQRWFIIYEKLLEPHCVCSGNKYSILAIGTSQIQFTVTVGDYDSEYILSDIYYIPNLNGNLLSVSTLNHKYEFPKPKREKYCLPRRFNTSILRFLLELEN